MLSTMNASALTYIVVEQMVVHFFLEVSADQRLRLPGSCKICGTFLRVCVHRATNVFHF